MKNKSTIVKRDLANINYNISETLNIKKTHGRHWENY